MGDPVLAGGGNNPFLYYDCDRDPTATEPDIDTAILTADYLFFWRNTTSGDVFIYGGGTSGSFIWNKAKLPPAAEHIADAATNAPTNLNTITTLLGVLTGEVNAANERYNDLATKFNTLLSHLETQNLQASS
jgi:hypothetical protein